MKFRTECEMIPHHDKDHGLRRATCTCGLWERFSVTSDPKRARVALASLRIQHDDHRDIVFESSQRIE